MEQQLAVAPDVDRNRERSLGRGRHHCTAQPPGVRVVKTGEHQPLLLRLERGDQPTLVVIHALCRAWACTVSIVSMIEIVSSNGMIGLSRSPAARRRA